MPSNNLNAKTILRYLDLLFWMSEFWNVIIYEMVRTSTKMHKTTFMNFDMASMRKLYCMTLTNFWRPEILNVNISEIVWASVKMHGPTLVDFDICHRMALLYNSVIMTYFLKEKIRQVNISEMVRASIKMHMRTFVYFNCHRMASLRKLYSMTLTYVLMVKNLKR